LKQAEPKLFDFDYPLFSPDYKKDFETKFIRQFYFTEIGYETEESIQVSFRKLVADEHVFWNNMLKSELIDFDPLTNTKVDSTANKTKDRTQNDIKDSTVHSTTDGT
jgi:hypothetical protein